MENCRRVSVQSTVQGLAGCGWLSRLRDTDLDRGVNPGLFSADHLGAPGQSAPPFELSAMRWCSELIK